MSKFALARLGMISLLALAGSTLAQDDESFSEPLLTPERSVPCPL